MLRLTGTDIQDTMKFPDRNEPETPPREMHMMDETRIMRAIEDLEQGLAELTAEAEAIDDLLAPIPFMSHEPSDDEGPWAA